MLARRGWKLCEKGSFAVFFTFCHHVPRALRMPLLVLRKEVERVVTSVIRSCH